MEHQQEEDNNHNNNNNNNQRNNDNNNNNNNFQLQIQDLDTWVNVYGLQEPEYGIGKSWAEARDRLRQEHSYQQSIHRAIFGNDDEGNEMEQLKQQRARLLDSWKNETIVVTTKSTPIPHVPLQPLASASDTVFALASSWQFFGNSHSNNNNNNNHSNQNNSNVAVDDSNDHQQRNQPSPPSRQPIFLSLDTFERDAVASFLDTVVGKTPVQMIPADYMVECCQISHYLQCQQQLDGIVEILIESIDTANCLSFCQLADALNLPRLFEQSLVHMMQTLGELQEQDQVWGDLSPELRERILTIKSAIQSSIHTQDRGRIYFGSLTEYLAIFAENIQYHRERLAEAKERQDELIHVCSFAAWADAQRKIDKHEQRVRTLEIVMAEQKKLFGAAATSSGCHDTNGSSGSSAFHHTFYENDDDDHNHHNDRNQQPS